MASNRFVSQTNSNSTSTNSMHRLLNNFSFSSTMTNNKQILSKDHPMSSRNRSNSLNDANPRKTDALQFKEVKTLEQYSDQQSVVVDETILVADNTAQKYALRLVELRNEETLRSIIQEIRILDHLGHHANTIGLFAAFGHRQFVGLLQSPFGTLRDRIDIMHRFKKTGGRHFPVAFYDPQAASGKKSSDWSQSRAYQCLKETGVFGPNAVVYVLHEVIAALDYLNSKKLVHTQIGSSSVFVDEKCAVKLGAFLHSRPIGSSDWEFTGDSSRLPPEAFQAQPTDPSPKYRVKENLDTWGLGLLVLEMVTGKRLRYTRDEMRALAAEFLDGTQLPPTLAETDPSTMGDKVYDPHVESFLEQCFVVNAAERCSPNQLLLHPFMKNRRDFDAAKANIGVESRLSVQWNANHSARNEILRVLPHHREWNESVVLQVLNAVQIVRERQCVPVFNDQMDSLHKHYVAIEAELTFLGEDEEWSREVLDVSDASQTPQSSQQQHCTNSLFSGDQEQQDYRRCEMVFFVHRQWTNENRRLFIAIQFARWYQRGLICFSDLVRVVDELDEVLAEQLSAAEEQCRDAIAFRTQLRKGLHHSGRASTGAAEKLYNIHLEVVFSGNQLEKKHEKFAQILEGDPVESRDQALGPLCASATYQSVNVKHMELVESTLLGEQRVHEWDFDPEQRLVDSKHSHTQLTTLLKERRRNPNEQVDSQIDSLASNQARRAKLWSDYTRDFMYRFAKYHVPYKLSSEDVETLYSAEGKSSSKFGFILDGLQKQLMRTRSKQEGDIVAPSKRHDDVQLRRKTLDRQRQSQQQRDEAMMNDSQAQIEMYKALAKTAGGESIPRAKNGESRADLTRLPRYNR